MLFINMFLKKKSLFQTKQLSQTKQLGYLNNGIKYTSFQEINNYPYVDHFWKSQILALESYNFKFQDMVFNG